MRSTRTRNITVTFARAAGVYLVVQAGACVLNDPPAPAKVPTATFRVLAGNARAPGLINLLFQVSTGDGAPLPGLAPEQFLLSEQAQTLASAFESNWEFIPRPRCFSLATVLILDMSGSIQGSGSLPQLQEAATAFVGSIVESNEVAIYTFDGRAAPELLVDFTTDLETLRAGIDELTNYEVADASTDLHNAILAGLTVLDRQLQSQESGAILEASLAVFTDGQDRAGRVSFADANAVVQSSPHEVVTIGLGPETNPTTLQQFGRSGSFFADDVNSLNTAFLDAGTAIQNVSRSYYSLAFCSARRSGDNTLFVWLDGFEGALSFEFNADDFGGLCSPGAPTSDQCILDEQGTP